MGQLSGFREYLKEHYTTSVFERIMASGDLWCFHLHGKKEVTARLVEDLPYDLRIDIEGEGERLLQKTEVKLLHPSGMKEDVARLVKKREKKVEQLNLAPIVRRRDRYFIKNKTLYPLMKEKEVIFITLLEGEIIRGVVLDFRRYELTMGLKGGLPVTVMRHAVYDAKNKAGRCFLKSFQQTAMDWKKSDLFVE